MFTIQQLIDFLTFPGWFCSQVLDAMGSVMVTDEISLAHIFWSCLLFALIMFAVNHWFGVKSKGD